MSPLLLYLGLCDPISIIIAHHVQFVANLKFESIVMCQVPDSEPFAIIGAGNKLCFVLEYIYIIAVAMKFIEHSF